MCLCVQELVGGRVVTFRKGQYIADLGAMVLTGLGKSLSTFCGPKKLFCCFYWESCIYLQLLKFLFFVDNVLEYTFVPKCWIKMNFNPLCMC